MNTPKNPLAYALRNARRALANTLPTLTTLNELSASHACLTLLRSLHTSDLAFMYMLLDTDTCRDLARMCDDMIKGDAPSDLTDDSHPLTAIEIREFNGYVTSLLEYANQH